MNKDFPVLHFHVYYQLRLVQTVQLAPFKVHQESRRTSAATDELGTQSCNYFVHPAEKLSSLQSELLIILIISGCLSTLQKLESQMAAVWLMSDCGPEGWFPATNTGFNVLWPSCFQLQLCLKNKTQQNDSSDSQRKALWAHMSRVEKPANWRLLCQVTTGQHPARRSVHVQQAVSGGTASINKFRAKNAAIHRLSLPVWIQNHKLTLTPCWNFN